MRRSGKSIDNAGSAEAFPGQSEGEMVASGEEEVEGREFREGGERVS